MTVKTPWHLWLVGGLSLLWNGYGFYNYLMSAMQGEAYYRAAGASDEMITYVLALPLWTWTAWAVGVGGGLLGALFLLLRRRLALAAYVLSLAGAAVLTVYQKAIDPAPNAATDVLPYVIVVAAGLQALYAFYVSKKDLLR